jgi:hypothetical protein
MNECNRRWIEVVGNERIASVIDGNVQESLAIRIGMAELDVTDDCIMFPRQPYTN